MLADVAKLEGWMRCSRCQTFVSLKHGCNHITCFCGFEFCYECGAEWADKGSSNACSCALFNEEMLYREGERQVEAQEDLLGRPLEREEAAAVWQGVQLMNDAGHECSHRSKVTLYLREFSKRKKRCCDNCEEPIPWFCYECTDCTFRVCKVCRFNRRLP